MGMYFDEDDIKRAESGDAAAQYHLALMYGNEYEAFCDSVDMAWQVYWLRKAAKQGHAGAQYDLGRMYKDGEGVPPSSAEAVKWLRKAAEQGDGIAGWELCSAAMGAYGYAEAKRWMKRVDAKMKSNAARRR